MNKLIFLSLILFIVSAIFVIAESDRFTLRTGESFQFEGFNFTVINVSPRTDSALFCVNNEKVIFSEDKIKRHKGATIEVIKVTFNDVRIDVEVEDGRECGRECSNSKCFQECKIDLDCDDGDEDTLDKCVFGNCRNNILEIVSEQAEEEVISNEIGEISIESEEGNAFLGFSIFLIAMVLILAFIAFLVKKK